MSQTWPHTVQHVCFHTLVTGPLKNPLISMTGLGCPGGWRGQSFLGFEKERLSEGDLGGVSLSLSPSLSVLLSVLLSLSLSLSLSFLSLSLSLSLYPSLCFSLPLSLSRSLSLSGSLSETLSFREQDLN